MTASRAEGRLPGRLAAPGPDEAGREETGREEAGREEVGREVAGREEAGREEAARGEGTATPSDAMTSGAAFEAITSGKGCVGGTRLMERSCAIIERNASTLSLSSPISARPSRTCHHGWKRKPGW